MLNGSLQRFAEKATLVVAEGARITSGFKEEGYAQGERESSTIIIGGSIAMPVLRMLATR